MNQLLFICISLFFLVQTDYKIGDEISKPELNGTSFYDIRDFKIEDEKIYIADFRGLNVYAFNLSGELIGKSGGEGRGPGEFVHGPRIITPAEDRVYAIGMMPFFYVYDSSLTYLKHEYFINNPINSYDMHFWDNKLFIALTQFYEEELIVYDLEKDSQESVFLDFELQPGLLAEYNMFSIGSYWLFTWNFQNQFRLYDKKFNLVREFSIDGLPKIADGINNELRMIPKEATSHRQKVYSLGTFMPLGTFFRGFVVLSDDYFLVQLGTQTGGSNLAMILDVKGNVVQEITLPQSGKVLGYSQSEGALYMLNQEETNVVAYEFYE